MYAVGFNRNFRNNKDFLQLLSRELQGIGSAGIDTKGNCFLRCKEEKYLALNLALLKPQLALSVFKIGKVERKNADYEKNSLPL